MWKFIAIALIGVIAVILIIAATQPNTLRVERAIDIKAAPEKILPFLSSLRASGFGAWSPYETKDPGMKRSYSGSESGVGAVYEWDGNSDVGQGRLEITGISPNTVTMQLDFIKPFEGHNIAEFALRPASDATHVVWSMDGPRPFISKVMGLFFNLDKMIGTDFEVGLAKLKALAEK